MRETDRVQGMTPQISFSMEQGDEGRPPKVSILTHNQLQQQQKQDEGPILDEVDLKEVKSTDMEGTYVEEYKQKDPIVVGREETLDDAAHSSVDLGEPVSTRSGREEIYWKWMDYHLLFAWKSGRKRYHGGKLFMVCCCFRTRDLLAATENVTILVSLLRIHHEHRNNAPYKKGGMEKVLVVFAGGESQPER